MELDPKYTFIPLENVNLPNLTDRTTQEYLEKWGLKDNLCIQQYSFNETFQMYHKYHLVESFFKSPTVYRTLKIKKDRSWIAAGIEAKSVDSKYIPCTVTSMTFFDKLKNPDNNIVWTSGAIQNTYYDEVDGFVIANNLQAALLDEASDNYNLYDRNEKEEFIFRIMQLLVLGGVFCQYEDDLQPYLDVTKQFYKDLIRVQKDENDKLKINTIVFSVVAKKFDDESYFPYNSEHRQNVAFLCINPHTRVITTLLHQYN